MPRIENWSTYLYPNNEYLAPELRPMILQGNIYEDSRFDDGSFIHTSRLIEIDIKNKFAKTSRTEYILGEPYEEFRTFYPEYFE